MGRTWICFPGIANAAAVVPVAPGEEAVEETRAAAAEAEAASMLEGPRTDTSVGAAPDAGATTEGPWVDAAALVPLMVTLVPAELGPITDTSVGATRPDVTTPVEDCWAADTVSVDESVC